MVKGYGNKNSKILIIGEAPGCFTADTKILTNKGSIEITETKNKDDLLDYAFIKNDLSYDVVDYDMYNFRVSKFPVTTCTSNHKILVRYRNYDFDKYKLPKKLSEPVWKSIEEIDNIIKNGNDVYTIIPKIKRECSNAYINLDIDKYKTRSRGNDKKIPNKIILDEDMAFLFGVYMGDGCCNFNSGHIGICISEGYKEKHKEKIINVMRRFGLEPSIYKKDKVINIYFTSRTLCEFFEDIFGNNCYNKRVPKIIFESKNSIMNNFLFGWYETDGCHKTNVSKAKKITSVSELAIWDGMILGLNCGVLLGINSYNNKRDNECMVHELLFDSSSILGLKWNLEVSKIISKKYGEDENNYYLKIHQDSIRRFKYSGKVYDKTTSNYQYQIPFVVHNSQEDQIGSPFVGRSGMMLDMWLATLELDRSKVYIDNTVKCIPLDENNKIRPPTDEEIYICRNRIDKTIEEMKPEIIITLGKTPLKLFTTTPLFPKSGEMCEYKEYKLFPLAHPAYFLRNRNMSWKPQLMSLYKFLHNKEMVNEDSTSLLFYDIETTNLDINEGKIKCIGYYSEKTKNAECLWNTDIKKFQTELDSHMFHSGFNQKEFDKPYIEARGLKSGGLQLDVREIAKKRNPDMKVQSISFSLDNLCKLYGIGEKKEVPLDVLLKDPEQNTEEEKNLIMEYCKHDVMLTKKLFDFYVYMFSGIGEFMSPSDKANYKYLTCGTGTSIYKILCHRFGYKEEYDRNGAENKIEGATVLQPKKEIYNNINGYIVDFKSAYPHAIMEQNLSTP